MPLRVTLGLLLTVHGHGLLYVLELLELGYKGEHRQFVGLRTDLRHRLAEVDAGRVSHIDILLIIFDSPSAWELSLVAESRAYALRILVP